MAVSGCTVMASVCLLLQSLDMLLIDCFPIIRKVFLKARSG